MSSLIEVEIAYARPDKQIILTILAPVGSTIEQVLLSSSIRDHFPEISLDDIKVGIFSKTSKLSTIVEEFDRIEIYRPLTGDPKEIRKIRAARIAKKNG